MRYGFQGLRADAVVRCHEDDGDVGDPGASGTHGAEGLVSRRGGEADKDGGAFNSSHTETVRRDRLAFLSTSEKGSTEC